MSGLDTLIGKSLDAIIRENLGETTLRRVEQRLFERYGMSLSKAIEDFPKLDSVLREFFGGGAEGLERKFLDSIVSLERSKDNSQEWVTIEDPILATSILTSLGDEDKAKILNAVLGESKVISEILETCKLPQTSGYRKVNSLIENGLLVNEGFMTTRDGKIVNKYRTVFENIHIDIVKNSVIIRILVPHQSLKNSCVMQIVCSS